MLFCSLFPVARTTALKAIKFLHTGIVFGACFVPLSAVVASLLHENHCIVCRRSLLINLMRALFIASAIIIGESAVDLCAARQEDALPQYW